MPNSLISLKEVNLTFDGQNLYHPSISFSLQPGERCLLFGPSASGKTVLFKLLAGLQSYTQGELLWKGEPLPKGRKRVNARNQLMSIIPSSFAFINGLSVKENILLPARLTSLPKQLLEDRYQELLELLNFSSENTAMQKLSLGQLVAQKNIRGLSNGQKEVVALARGLILPTPLLLADELLRSFNAEAELLIWQRLISWLKKQQQSLFMITHKEHLMTSLTNQDICSVFRINSGQLEKQTSVWSTTSEML